MAFTDKQHQALRAKLRYQNVKRRISNGASIAYVEGWHAIAEANRIFGYDSWDRKTLSPRCLWTETQGGQATCFYATKVSIVVRAGGAVIVREGIGTGFGRAATPEMAHEMALKAAETDATKRALATFGNPFGLALYDKDQAQVTKPRKPDAQTVKPDVAAAPADGTPDLVLHREDGRDECFEDPAEFVAATLKTLPGLATIDALYNFWQANRDSLAVLRRRTAETGDDPVAVIIAALKGRARALGHVGDQAAAPQADRHEGPVARALAFPKEKRRRDKDHLRYVARQPCLVCGRRPTHAHHVRFAQPRAMGLKVSDEYTVPLCNGHHDALHRVGDERAWWARHGIIDPLKFAARLWAASRLGASDDADDPSSPDGDEFATTSPIAAENRSS